MDFEKNTAYNEGEFDLSQSLVASLTRNVRVLYVIAGILLVLVLTFSVFALKPYLFPADPGGMDGCLRNAVGGAVSGTVSVGRESMSTYDNGCFFFSDLRPGVYKMTIETANGYQTERSVEIISGQAVALGTIVVP